MTGPGTKEGRLMGGRGAEQQGTSVAGSSKQSGGLKSGGTPQRCGGGIGIATLTYDQIGPMNSCLDGANRCRQTLGGGSPVVGAPEQQPILRIRQGETLIHRTEDAGLFLTLRNPAAAGFGTAALPQPASMLRVGRAVDEQQPPMGPALLLQRKEQTRQQRVRVERRDDDQ